MQRPHRGLFGRYGKSGSRLLSAGNRLSFESLLAAPSPNRDSVMRVDVRAASILIWHSEWVFSSADSVQPSYGYVRSFCFFLWMYASRSSGSMAILLFPTRRYGNSPL
jgi:hypothetical protein